MGERRGERERRERGEGEGSNREKSNVGERGRRTH
jgi:hypothetical protein